MVKAININFNGEGYNQNEIVDHHQEDLSPPVVNQKDAEMQILEDPPSPLSSQYTQEFWRSSMNFKSDVSFEGEE